MAQRIVIPGFRKIETSGGGQGGTSNYNELTNKPSINNVPLVGNLNTVDLKLTDATLTEEGVPAEAKTVGDKIEEQSTSLTALAEQLGNHIVKSDVPENAVFTDTVYDDTQVQKRISDNGYGEVVGGKNLLNTKEFIKWVNQYTNGRYSNDEITISPVNTYLYNNFFKFSDTDIDVTLSIKSLTFEDGSNPRVCLVNSAGTIIGTVTTDIPSASGLGCGIKIDFTTLPTSITIKELMIEEGSVATEYEPYFPSNKMLAEEKADKSETTVNLLNPTLQTTALNGITCTNNGDGTYTLNGTSTASSNTNFVIPFSSPFKGKCKLIGCPSDIDSIAELQCDYNGVWDSKNTDHGKGSILDSTNLLTNIAIVIFPNVTVNNIVFKLMITTNLNATYDDFVPYTGDSGSLNGDVAKLKNDLVTVKELTLTTNSSGVVDLSGSAYSSNGITLSNLVNAIILDCDYAIAIPYGYSNALFIKVRNADNMNIIAYTSVKLRLYLKA